MASTFSPNLLLELQATGENDGTWGVRLNTDLTITDSFAGGRLSIDVSGSSDVTLSDAQARNTFHFLTGTLTGNINYIVPSRGRYYYVNNGTSGAYTVTVKQSGGTGIVVPQGTSMLVFNDPDNTEAISPFDYLPSLTLGAGLPTASGGTGLTSGTSGGLLYFSGTTTLASSGALTANNLLLGGGAGAAPSALGSLGTTTTVLHGNASGAPTFGAVSLTADVSGTLPVANGGTAATTAADARTSLGVPSLTGTGASGTWGINISGNAATATSATSASSATSATTATTATNVSGGTANVTSLTVTSGGASITGTLSVSGAITATSNITAFASDMRLKDKIGPILNPLEKVRSLSAFYYILNDKAVELGIGDKRLRVGLSAQEVQKIFPEIIERAPADPEYMTFAYSDLVPLLIESMKALEERVQELEEEI